MLSPDRLIPDILANYPEHLRAQLQADFQTLLYRQRHYLISQIQLLFSRHPGAASNELRHQLDELFVSDSNAATDSRFFNPSDGNT